MKVVIAIDEEQSAKTALEYTLKGKYDKNTEFYMVHAIAPSFADAPVEGIPDVVAEERQEEQVILDNLANALRQKLGAKIQTGIFYGEIAQVIADECKHFDADETIIPSHARHGFSRLWFGSVADEIVDAAPCTVIVLKMPQTNKAH